MSHDDLRLPYQPKDDPALVIGGIIVDEQLLPDAPVGIVLKSFNRHGLIAGATGSGKTKTIQVLAEQLSKAGVPSLVMDIKGDISGLAMPGEENNFITQRAQSLNLTFKPTGFPVEFLALDEGQSGVPLRATVNSFGAVLFARLLDVNDTQAGVLTIMFEFAKAQKMPLIDLADMKSLLQYVQTPQGKTEIEAQFGAVASSSVGAIVRAIIELQAQGADAFFGEPAFDVHDLIRVDNHGQGIISILRLLDMQDKPKLFSTFMLKLLSDVYRVMPELGDPEKPKLVIFIDEAHLIFNQATKALLNMLETMVKLIRSKGIGLIFCTQMPDDVPDAVLSQLGLKVQHALRAFTAKDRKAMKLVAQNFPPSTIYNTEDMLTSLGIGEALLTSLDAKGQPTPLIDVMIRAPESRMGILNEQEMQAVINRSTLMSKYQNRIESDSAKEMLAAKQAATASVAVPSSKGKVAEDPSFMTTIAKSTLFRQIVRQFMRDFMRTIMNGFKKK